MVKRLTTSAKLPSRGSEQAAGYDLYADGDWTIPEGGVLAVSTGIALQIPEGCVGLIRDRSGMASKAITTHVARAAPEALKAWLDEGSWPECGYKEHPLGGVIDSDYRGEVKVILLNAGAAPYAVKKGDRVAQFLVIKCEKPDVIECETLPVQEGELSDTARGTGGLGSTGK